MSIENKTEISEVIRAAVDAKVYDVVEAAFNFHREDGDETAKAVEYARENGVGIVAMKVFGGAQKMDYDLPIPQVDVEHLELAVRYSAADLTMQDMTGLRHLYYQRTYARLAEFLNCDLNSADIQAVIEKYRPEHARQDQKGLHFNKGLRGRFRDKLTVEQQTTLANAFGAYLERLGYQI